MFGMVVAKRVMNWKSTLPPTFHKWLTEMVAALKLEIICFARTDAFKRYARKRPQIFPNFVGVESWALKIHGQFYSYFSTPFLMCLEFDEVKLYV